MTTNESTHPHSSPAAAAATVPPHEHRLHPGLIALATGGFGIGLTEFIIAGLLNDVARDLDVGVAAAGMLIWGYALSVVVGAFTVAVALSRRPPKTALMVLLALFVVGNTLTAFAPDLAAALAGRVLTALCHGGFFGIGAVVAGELVVPARKARAIAVMFGGLTLANVLGVPFGTFVGQQLGWRATFWIIAAVGALALAAVAALVPRLPAHSQPSVRQFAVLRRPQVVISMLLTVTVFGGVFGAVIYLEPIVTHVTGYRENAVPWLLVLVGVGLFAGNLLGGRAADADLASALRVLTVLLALCLATFALVAAWRMPVGVVLFLLGLIGFAATPALQLRIMRFASDSPTLASTANIAAFNLGNAFASALGAGSIALGLGWRAPIVVSIGMAIVGVALAFTNAHIASPNES